MIASDVGEPADCSGQWLLSSLGGLHLAAIINLAGM